MTTENRLKGRIALVTGATRGIGRAVALALAGDGAHVIICGRTAGALEELDDAIRAKGGTATLLHLDLRRGERVDQIGPTLYSRWGKLDILVACAGILGPLSPLAHVTEDAWAAVLQINLTTNWHLIRTLDPLLRRSDAGRAVFVSSGTNTVTGKKAYWGPYAVSKAGLEVLARTYAHEVAGTSVRVNIVNPGPVRTGMRAKAYPGEDPALLPPPEDVAPLFLELASPDCTANGELVHFREWRAKRPAPVVS